MQDLYIARRKTDAANSAPTIGMGKSVRNPFEERLILRERRKKLQMNSMADANDHMNAHRVLASHRGDLDY